MIRDTGVDAQQVLRLIDAILNLKLPGEEPPATSAPARAQDGRQSPFRRLRTSRPTRRAFLAAIAWSVGFLERSRAAI